MRNGQDNLRHCLVHIFLCSGRGRERVGGRPELPTAEQHLRGGGGDRQDGGYPVWDQPQAREGVVGGGH